MNESARAHSISRRAFLRRATVATAGVAIALTIGEQAWESLERAGPRRLLVAAPPKLIVGSAEIEKMIRYQARQAIRAMGRTMSRSMYGDPGLIMRSVTLAGYTSAAL